ncbi:hypothetical protein BV898_15788 [Hypsibius exemplaris]|uniref:non-specific serine/threonine protein kinase n=1 Tax=Hypsibius exemplaris TaxID=2072580 RepID=A0A9X6NDR0_HYPEX|nr:hypothetical protein BV898_15788 [Hypsibius exemplaris]
MSLHSAHEYLTHIRAENGEKFHCFLLPDLLGHGSFGVVMKVNLVQSEHDGTPLPGTPHALKYFHDFYDSEKMFKLSVLPTLDCENIVKYLAVGYTYSPGTPIERLKSCLIMELCDGGTLEEFLVKHPPPLSVDTILNYTGQIARALNYLHSQRGQHHEAIFHGDLKPLNVMLHSKHDDCPVLKLTDLDSFTQVRGEHTRRSDLSTKKGTIRYMSPEMLAWNPDTKLPAVGRSTDIWSLGCIVLRMSCVDWLDCRASDGRVFKGDRLNDRQFETLLTDGGSPKIPKNSLGTIRHIVTACLCWQPFDRLSAKDLSQYIAKVTLKNSQTIALNIESSKDVRRTNVLTILSGIPTILGRIIKALIEAGAGARWPPPELYRNARNAKPLHAKLCAPAEHGDTALVNNRFLQNLARINDFLHNAKTDYLSSNARRSTLLGEYLAKFGPSTIHLTIQFRNWLANQNDTAKQIIFLQAYHRYDIPGHLRWMENRLTATVGPHLITDLMAHCQWNFMEFLRLEQTIYCLVCQLCSITLGHLWLLIVTSYEPPEEVTERVRSLEASVTTVLLALESARLHAKSSFLFLEIRGYKEHVNCGATEDGCCNALSARVYQLMTKHAESATDIRTALQAAYPLFQWSVITAGTDQLRTSSLDYDSPDAADLLWLQKMENSKKSQRKRGNIARAARSLKYGELRWRTDQLDCLVLWTEAKNFEEGRNFPVNELRDYINQRDDQSIDFFVGLKKLNLLYYRERPGALDNQSLAEVNGVTYPLTLQDHPNIYFWPVASESLREVDS